MVSQFELIFRLLLSAMVGGVIGMEREANNRPAGFRTHILVTMGSALIMLISTQGFNGVGDPGRLSAQVVSGIGFLGAGTIVRTGNNIKGLTTAASLWVCGGLGLAIGGGFYLGGLVTTAIVFTTLTLLGGLDDRLINKKCKVVNLQCRERAGLIGDLGQVFGNHDIMIKDIQINRNEIESDDLLNHDTSSGTVELRFTLVFDKRLNPEGFNDVICRVEGVENIKWET